jgi:hypothetical protein
VIFHNLCENDKTQVLNNRVIGIFLFQVSYSKEFICIISQLPYIKIAVMGYFKLECGAHAQCVNLTDRSLKWQKKENRVHLGRYN